MNYTLLINDLFFLIEILIFAQSVFVIAFIVVHVTRYGILAAKTGIWHGLHDHLTVYLYTKTVFKVLLLQSPLIIIILVLQPDYSKMQIPILFYIGSVLFLLWNIIHIPSWGGSLLHSVTDLSEGALTMQKRLKHLIICIVTHFPAPITLRILLPLGIIYTTYYGNLPF